MLNGSPDNTVQFSRRIVPKFLGQSHLHKFYLSNDYIQLFPIWDYIDLCKTCTNSILKLFSIGENEVLTCRNISIHDYKATPCILLLPYFTREQMCTHGAPSQTTF